MKNFLSKFFATFLMVCMFSIPIAATTQVVHASSITDKVKQNQAISDNSSQIASDIDSAAAGLIKVVRQIAIIVAVCIVIFFGYALFFSGANSISKYKVQAIILVVALILVFKAESIVGALYGMIS